MFRPFCFTVEKVMLEKLDGTVEAGQISDKQWKLEIRLEPQTVKAGARLWIQTDCTLQPELVIPLSGRKGN